MRIHGEEQAAIHVGTEADRERVRAHCATFEGCDASDIDRLEQRLACVFPNVFREFLMHFGRNCSYLFDGATLEMLELFPSLRDTARLMVAELEQPELIPENAVVFIHHQGYDFAFFVPSNEDADPPVYWCSEAGSKREAAPSITDFLRSYTRSEPNST